MNQITIFEYRSFILFCQITKITIGFSRPSFAVINCCYITDVSFYQGEFGQIKTFVWLPAKLVQIKKLHLLKSELLPLTPVANLIKVISILALKSKLKFL